MGGRRGIISLGIATIIVLSVISFIAKTRVSASPGTIYVGGSGPGNYTSIQDAIDNASNGDAVFVFSGTYYENVVVDKSINLVGEDRNLTVIDGGGKDKVVNISADGVTISGFNIRNSEGGWLGDGIEIHSNYNTISGNIISNND